MSEKLLDVEELNVIYETDLETVNAVNGISFHLNKGETLGIVGETGAGKTTTALSLLRLLPDRTARITNGSVHFKGHDVLSSSDKEIQLMRGNEVAMIFQDPMTSLNPVLTIGDQIREAILLHNKNESRTVVEERLDEVLSLVNIPSDRKENYPHEFSGGMRQRVLIAMALVCNPDLIIADEPTTALDVTIQAQILLMIRKLVDESGTAMILITHDLGIVAQVCDKVAVMYAGKIIESGTAEDIFVSQRHHPYTVGLFGSLPNLKEKSDRLNPIPGLMPDPTDLPKGCPFYPRCPRAMKICSEEKPSLFEEGTKKIYCHLFSG